MNPVPIVALVALIHATSPSPATSPPLIARQEFDGSRPLEARAQLGPNRGRLVISGGQLAQVLPGPGIRERFCFDALPGDRHAALRMNLASGAAAELFIQYDDPSSFVSVVAFASGAGRIVTRTAGGDTIVANFSTGIVRNLWSRMRVEASQIDLGNSEILISIDGAPIASAVVPRAIEGSAVCYGVRGQARLAWTALWGCAAGEMFTEASCQAREANRCADGVTTSSEECDDGNTSDGDGCSAVCTAEFCGDALLSGVEECDDGNTSAGDGCSAVCTIESCGDSILTGTEECDDGNTAGGDGCSSLCRIEPTVLYSQPFDAPNFVEGIVGSQALFDGASWLDMGGGSQLYHSNSGRPSSGSMSVRKSFISSWSGALVYSIPAPARSDEVLRVRFWIYSALGSFDLGVNRAGGATVTRTIPMGGWTLVDAQLLSSLDTSEAYILLGAMPPDPSGWSVKVDTIIVELTP